MFEIILNLNILQSFFFLSIVVFDKISRVFNKRQLNAVFGWLVGFVALRPKSTAMVIAGRSVHLTTLFPGQA